MVEIAMIWDYIQYIEALVILLLTLVVARVVMRFFEKYLEKFAARTKIKGVDVIIKTIKGPLYILILLLGIHLALIIVKFPFLAQIGLVFKIIGAILGTWVIYNIVPALMQEYGRSLAKRTKTSIDQVVIPVLERIVKVFLLIVGILLILNILKINITPLLAGMGIAGLAIALALQDTLSNMFSGFYMMLDHPFKLGDRIMLGAEELYEVRDVGMRSTRLYDIINHTIVTIPNSELSKMKLTNLVEPDRRLKVRIPIGVAYGSDMAKVRRVLLEIAKEAPDVLDDPEPKVIFNEFDDFSLNLILIVWIEDVTKKVDVIDHINSRIKERFEEENIEIPFPIRTLYMKRGK
ncbi:MAG: mechanosensitive ion channel family protein [Methanocellales archaeon]|nr:mechanosensitive ion channel family protein [Methanocellales archaeon]MDD3291470.1 mechanosensitive ion channel family protein [Methanocellales archaeon]MDD5234640.1 mechanosensitive ion channel family protein [Methanocellales archaeon]MDD5485007.1 mechanosensitive ion channel family protein [Methanocellales archaeon]